MTKRNQGRRRRCAVRSHASRIAAYESWKAAFVLAHPDATAVEYQRAMRAAALALRI